jgi:uncharacterized protein (TIGR02266 family)
MLSTFRRRLRIPQPIQLVVEEGPPRFLGYVSDISDTGLFVQSTNPRQAGGQLELQFRLPGEPEELTIKLAEVVWSRGYSGKGGPTPGMGLRFVAISHAARASLERFLARCEPSTTGGFEVPDSCR